MRRKVSVRPGKGQSIAGMVVGIFFCLLGLFFVIPTFGLFGIVWTAVAGIITAVNGVNAFSGRGLPTHEIMIDEDGGEADGRDAEERLRALRRLYDGGMITSEEYEQKKKEILAEL